MTDTHIYTEQIVTTHLCNNGHTVIWAGTTTGEIPEGVPCSCGLTVTHYTVCKECGNRKLELIPVGGKP